MESFFTDNLDITGSNEPVDEKKVLDHIQERLQEVLDTRFQNNQEKRKIRFGRGKYNFACPFCGDSQVSSKKKRGNIWISRSWFKCYNCGKSTDLESFYKLNDAPLELSPSEIKWVRSMVSAESSPFARGSSYTTYLAELDEVEGYAIPRADLMYRIGMVDVENSPQIYNYLRSKMRYPEDGDTRHLAADLRGDKIFILNLNRTRENVISYQIRYMKPKNGIRFMTRNYQAIWEEELGIKISPEIADIMNSYSNIFNILQVSFSRDIPIFEAAFDSQHMRNSMAIMSASNFIYLDNGLYFFDNTIIDKAGRDSTMKMLSEGHKVFLWYKFLKDYPQYNRCKDLNDIMCKAPIHEQELRKYFSNDKLDMFYI